MKTATHPVDRHHRTHCVALTTALSLVVASMPGAAQSDLIFRSGFEVMPTVNDTGITISGRATATNSITCNAADPANQDCAHGRDALAAAGQLAKVGASSPVNGLTNGFDYTKVSNAGADLSANAVLGPGSNDWACTRDNVTGLVWEVKTTVGLRNQYDTYTWYDPTVSDGVVGKPDGGECVTAGRCDTQKYVADVNSTMLCGMTGWRMPTVTELEGIVDYGRQVEERFDPVYFPNTMPELYWTGSPFPASAPAAWIVNFGLGDVTWGYRAASGITQPEAFHVRVVHDAR